MNEKKKNEREKEVNKCSDYKERELGGKKKEKIQSNR